MLSAAECSGWHVSGTQGDTGSPGGVSTLNLSYIGTLGYLAPALLLLALACSQTAEAPPLVPTTATATPSAGEDVPVLNRTPKEPPPKVDKSIAIVPIEEVVFDTFRGGFIRLSDASDETIEMLRDLIKPVYQPRYESVEGGDWLSDDDMVLGYVSKSGTAVAYPVTMLNLHEIVNDVIDGVPVLISYCPLCVSGVVYDRELDGEVLLFGNTSSLYESDLVMYDHETGSYWFQVLGEAIVGPLSGKRLTMLPSVTAPWGQWKELHPETSILSRDLGLLPFGSSYDRNRFLGYDDAVNRGDFAFPVSEDKLDSRLRPGDRVFAVQVGEVHKAYPITERPDAVVNDVVGGKEIVVVSREAGPTAASFERTLEGRTLSFGLEGGQMVDAETGSRWDDAGRAVAGPLTGTQLERVPSRTSFWFSLVGSLPDVELHLP